jgi:hypothetical protein
MPDPVIVSYPFDATGILQTNRILDEQHAVTENNFRNYYFIVPKFAPFFADNISIVHSYQGESRVLVENVDYYCALMFIGATRAIGKPIYGAITLNNLNTAGIISLTYNTLGGKWNVDQQYIIEQIAEKAYNPRTVSWEQIVDSPETFPPIPHQWELVDLVGLSEVVDRLSLIEQAILMSGQNQASNHIVNFNNPHYVTKSQIGLSNVENWKIATQTEVLEGDSNMTLITPKTLSFINSFYYLKSEVDTLINGIKPPIISRAKTYFLAQL